MKDNVTVPLETLVGLFQNPSHLILKRKDKLLDYDHLQYALDHAEDSEKIAQLREDVLVAKRNYEALNTQLLEELPSFMECVMAMLQHQLTVLIQAQYMFCSSVADILPSLLPSSQHTTAPELEKQHAEQLVTVCKELNQLSLVPASLCTNFSLRTGGHRSSDSNSPQKSTPSSADDEHTPPRGRGHVPDIEEEGEEEEGEEEEQDHVFVDLEGGVPVIGTHLEVLFDFVGQDPAELSVKVGESVVLQCPHDRIGCKEWWLVQHNQNQGYVPASYLTQYNDNHS